MAHPAKLLDELKNTKPNASIDHWVYGVLHTDRSTTLTGSKGLLAASDGFLLFKGGNGEDPSVLEASLAEVGHIEDELQGTVNLTIRFTDGSYMEMAYISRGNIEGFITFLQNCLENSGHPLVTVDKSK